MNNQFNNIKLPNNIDDVIDLGVEKACAQKKNKNKKFKIKVASTILIITTTLTILGIKNPAFASSIPLIGGIFEKLQDKINFSGNYKDYSSNINEISHSNGTSVTISEALCDGESLYITYKIESKKPFKYTTSDESLINYIDNSNIGVKENELMQILEEGTIKTNFSNIEIPTATSGIQGNYLDKNTFIGAAKYDIPKLNTTIPKDFKLNINLKALSIPSTLYEPAKDIVVNKDQILRGNWKFNIPISTDNSLVKIINVNKRNNYGSSLDSISITPFEIKLQGKTEKIPPTKAGGKIHQYGINIKDDKDSLVSSSSQTFKDGSYSVILERKNINSRSLTLSLFEEILCIPDENGNTTIIDEKTLFSTKFKID
ncbi:DUF4179 domain-containing protein [Clostridium sardiniense]|uniref:DUF4179 domain-containing protein n=1 Tax=Clostridium sardiniense TaxID=29369 RepID=UPI0019575CDE|nr:DUF4179 domain-containing protein [Clostridium sardiniense]MBM7834544.1 uncharacterized protein YpmS [Clostridium sardiniense]